MKSQRKTEKAQKVRQKDLFSVLAKKNFLYEAEKKISSEKPSLEQFFFSEDKIFCKNEKPIIGSTASHLNNKETLLPKRVSFRRIKFRNHSNNSKDLAVQRVNCYSRRTTSNEKQEDRKLLFNKEYITNDIFCEFFI